MFIRYCSLYMPRYAVCLFAALHCLYFMIRYRFCAILPCWYERLPARRCSYHYFIRLFFYLRDIIPAWCHAILRPVRCCRTMPQPCCRDLIFIAFMPRYALMPLFYHIVLSRRFFDARNIRWRGYVTPAALRCLLMIVCQRAHCYARALMLPLCLRHCFDINIVSSPSYSAVLPCHASACCSLRFLYYAYWRACLILFDAGAMICYYYCHAVEYAPADAQCYVIDFRCSRAIIIIVDRYCFDVFVFADIFVHDADADCLMFDRYCLRYWYFDIYYCSRYSFSHYAAAFTPCHAIWSFSLWRRCFATSLRSYYFHVAAPRHYYDASYATMIFPMRSMLVAMLMLTRCQLFCAARAFCPR